MMISNRRFTGASLLCCLALIALLINVNTTTARTTQKSRSARLVRAAEGIAGDRFTWTGGTPAGVRIFAYAAPNKETLTAIDKGFTSLFAIARRHNYRARTNHAEYTVFIARPDRTTNDAGAYSPDIRINSVGNYAGSRYDRGGYLYAAGMVLSFEPCAFIIAEHTRDLNRVAEVVRYEGEHLVLYHNDQERYRRTADHSREGGHPILQ